jgi:hypothetical protein
MTLHRDYSYQNLEVKITFFELLWEKKFPIFELCIFTICHLDLYIKPKTFFVLIKL